MGKVKVPQSAWQQFVSGLDAVDAMLSQYPKGQVPVSVLQQVGDILTQAEKNLTNAVIQEPLPTPLDQDVLGLRPSPYFKDPLERRQEIDIHAKAGTVGSNVEGAFKIALKRLTEIGNAGIPSNANIAFLAALCLEILTQWREAPYDLRAIPEIAELHRIAVAQQRQEAYNRLIGIDWDLVCARYRSIGEFYVDIDGYRVYPTNLTLEGELYLALGCEPVKDRPGIVRTFEVEDQKAKERWQKEVGPDISIGSLKEYEWDAGVYGKVVEPLKRSFKPFIMQRVAEFKAKYGIEAPIMTFKGSLREVRMLGGIVFQPGFKVTTRGAEKPEKT